VPSSVEEHLFRREAGRIVSALTRIFGVHNLALAEDVTQDALCRALEVWKLRGVPENPSAWLMMTAKNAALDVLRRERTARKFAPDLGRLLDSEWTLSPVVTNLFRVEEIRDDELRMMFTCCHPKIAEEAQIALILNILSGFGVSEIAHAFLSSHAAIEKRLQRAKHDLAESKTLFDFGGEADISARLDAIHRAIYLLFNEGYHGSHPEETVRSELCREALRLCDLLTRHAKTARPETFALGALMCLHAARMPARLNDAGDLNLLRDQDRSLWDAALISDGLRLLHLSSDGASISEYHVEAAIAAEHATAPSFGETHWGRIVQLYETLFNIRPTPVVALQRAIAIAQRDGAARGLEELAAIENADRLKQYPFFSAALGDFELQLGKKERALPHFEDALRLSRNRAEARFFELRIAACK
jgi:RNA polymerase sigma-70 factor (ECF subfamily)